MAITYSLGNYHSVADSPGLTLPDSDWTWLFFVNPSNTATTQFIVSNGAWGAANTMNINLSAASSTLQLGTNPSVFSAFNFPEWTIVMARRQTGLLSLHVAQVESAKLFTGNTEAITGAIDMPNVTQFGASNIGTVPFLGDYSDAIFLPGIGLSASELMAIAGGSPFKSRPWWNDREFHAIFSTASSELDNTGNHTVTKVGSPTQVADSSRLTRFSETPDGNMYIIGYNAVTDATLSATSTAAGFDVDNLAIASKADAWRSTSLANQTITATWTESEAISAAGIAFSNLDAGSTVTINLYTNASDVSPVYSLGPTGITFSHNPPTGFSSIGLDSYPFGGGSYFSAYFPVRMVKKVELVLSSPANAEAYIEASNVILGEAIVPGRGSGLGSRISMVDNSEVIRKENGDSIVNRKSKQKRLSIPLASFDPEDKVKLMQIRQDNGTAIPVFINADQHNINRGGTLSYTIYGYFEQVPDLNNFSYDRFSTELSVVEI